MKKDPNHKRIEKEELEAQANEHGQIRHSVHSMHDIFDLIGSGSGDGFLQVRLEGLNVQMDAHSYRMYREKGSACVECGMQGEIFAIERSMQHGIAFYHNWHFNLYGYKNGQEVMMTKDHIQPRAAGGKDHPSNYQPMCLLCNNEKANLLPQEWEYYKGYKEGISEHGTTYISVMLQEVVNGIKRRTEILSKTMTPKEYRKDHQFRHLCIKSKAIRHILKERGFDLESGHSSGEPSAI